MEKVRKYFFRIFVKQDGFTLVELLVSVSLFSFTVLMATGLFGAVMRGQANTLASQNSQESIRYALEVISKEIRMAQSSDGSCNTLLSPQPTPVNKIYNIMLDGNGNQVLYFKNQNGACVAYYLFDDKINIVRDYNTGSIMPSVVKINNLKFFVTDNTIGSLSQVQPMVTIKVEATTNISRGGNSKIGIQASVSSRNYE